MSSKNGKQPAPIPLPPATRQRVEALISQQQALQGQIEAIIWTARDLLNVPGEYILRQTGIGFEPPPPPPTPREGADTPEPAPV